MIINFCSRQKLKNLLNPEHEDYAKEAIKDYAIISISDTTIEYAEMWDLLQDNGLTFSCSLFKDIEEGSEVMSDLQAQSILVFISKHPNKNFLVHCFAGVSRSGAVAKFINEYLEAGNWYLEDYMGHNTLVFNKLQAAAGNSLAAYYLELEKADRGISNS